MSDITWANVTVKLSDLLPWTGNPKTSTGKNAKQLQTSHDELGQFQTVAIEPTDKAGVYQVADGHQRLSAWLAKYGKAAEIDARLASRPLTETERRKIAIYSRQIGAWDWDVLSGWEPEELTGWGFDVDLLQDWRRDVAALGNFLESEEEQGQGDAEPQTNRADELRELWGVELGQMWRFPSRTEGQEHRLICGDCTDAAVVERVMGGERAHMVFTDPPYGVSYRDTGAGAWDEKKKALKRAGLLLPRFEKIEGDDLDGESLYLFLVSSFLAASNICDPKAAWYVFHASKTQTIFEKALNEVDYIVRSQLIWYKTRPAFNFSQYKFQHEPLFYAFRNGESPYWYGDKAQTTVWSVQSENGANYAHPTQKPTQLPGRAIENSTRPGDIVYEPFSGSGTTIIAAENLSRQCRAVEISPAYVAVALQRYADAFGIRAELVE